MTRIFIIGYMGAGKTTLGVRLAEQLALPFIDLDQYIERQQGKTIAQIFADNGEPAFRIIERDALKQVAEGDSAVIACGGGTPCFYDNIELMNSRGLVVYIKPSADVIYAHLQMGGSIRPLLLGKTPKQVMQFIKEQTAARQPFYSKARYTLPIPLLDSDEKIKQTTDNIMQTLGMIKH